MMDRSPGGEVKEQRFQEIQQLRHEKQVEKPPGRGIHGRPGPPVEIPDGERDRENYE
jgi:hypothetical protein